MPTLRFIPGLGSGSSVGQGVIGQISTLNQAIANLNNLTASLAPIVPQKSISFYLNGNFVTVENPDADMTLLTYLRNYTHFVGTKQGCAQGGCGICTIMLSFKDVNNVPKNISVNSCLVKLVNCNNLAVTTIEGLGNLNDLHPIQNYFVKIGAYQCGYCTSGQIMNMYSSFQSYAGQSNNKMTPSFTESERIMGGNLCRCTGYRPIIEVLKTLMVTEATGASSPYINTSDPTQVSEYQALFNKWHSNSTGPRFLPVYNQTGTDTFNCNSYVAQAVTEGRTSLVQVPTVDCEFTAEAGFNHYNLSSFASVANVVKTVSDLSTISIVQGQTSYGVPGYRRESNETVLINVSTIPEIHSFVATGTTGAAEVTFGSGLTISEIYDKLSGQSHRVFTSVANYFLSIIGWQVRNQATWAGGMLMAKKSGFLSDTTLCLLALEATINFKSIDASGNIGTSSTPISNFLSNNFSLSNSVVIVTSATISVNANQHLKVYRSASRIFNAHAQAHIAFSLDIDGSNNIDNSKIFVGAIGFTGATGSGVASYQEFTAGETYLNSVTTSSLTNQGLVDAARSTNWDIHPDYSAPNKTEASQIEYKEELIYGFCVRFVDEIQGNSLNTILTKKSSFGTQEYGTPEGDFDNIYDYVIDPNSVHIKKYKPPHPEKATGQTLYATDLSVNEALWSAPIICNKSLAGKIDYTPNPADLFGRPYLYATIDFTNVEGILKGIEIAESMPGVKLILTHLDYKPNTQNAGKSQFSAGGAFAETSSALFSTLYSGLFVTPPAGPFAGINLGEQFMTSFGSTNSSWMVRPFTDKVWWHGEMIGLVVAETHDLAISASRVISSYITFVTPAAPGNPIVEVNTSNLSLNVPYGRESLTMLGTDNPGWGNFDGTFSKPSATAIAYYSTGSTGSGIGDFDVVYGFGTGASSTGTLPIGTFRMTGTTYMGSIDHFPMERHAITVYPDIQDKLNVYISAQGPVTAVMHMDDMFTFGTGSFGGLNTFYNNSGPAREVDGTLVYNPSQFNYKTAQVGGAFGMKFYGGHVWSSTMLAAKRLDRPVKTQWIYSDDIINNGGSQAQHLLYEMAFDSEGKIKALSNDRYVNMGSFNESNLAITYGDNDTARIAKSLLNFGAYKSRLNLVRTSKPPSGAVRSYGQSQGGWSANIVTQNISHFLATGSTGSSATYTGPSQFDVLVKNLITPSSPFVNTNGEILTNLGEVQVASPLEFDGYQNDGYQYLSEPSHDIQLRAIDRKVFDLFYTAGTGIYGSLEYNVSNPTGGTGAYLTVDYDNTSLRYPAIKQLETDVKRFNALPANKFIKQGVAVGASTYLMTQGWNVSAEVKMQLDTADGKIKIITNYTDAGVSADNRLLMSIADSMLLDPSTFKVINGEDPVSGGLTNAGSQDSVGLMKAGFASALDFLKKTMDAIFEDLTYAQGVPQFYGLINPFPLAGKVDCVPFTGPNATFPSGLTIPTQGVPVPSAADLAWVKDGYGAFLSTGSLNSVEAYNEQINLMLVTLIRYVNQQYTQQYGAPQPGVSLFVILAYADWNNFPRAVKSAFMSGYWQFIKAGMIGGAPNVLNLSYVYGNPNVGNGGPLRYPTNQGVSTIFFGSTLRKITGIGRIYGSNYNAYFNSVANNRIDGCALSLVEVNTLTGEYKEKEAIVSIDIGHSSEPITDIGQIEGAYAFGKGYFLKEDKYFNPTSGELLNNDTWEYKMICSGDTPERLSTLCLNYTGSINGPGDLPVASFLLPNGSTVAYPQPKYPGMPNKGKAIGEVSTPLGVVPFMAVREAIANYRLQNNIDNNTTQPTTRNTWLDTVATAPITNNKVKNACPLPTTL